MKALVLDGCSRGSLSIVRSLGRRGVDITVASERKSSLAGSSRYCARRITYPSPRLSADAFVEWLSDTLVSMPGAVLYTASDITTSLVGRYRDRLPSLGLLLPPQDALETALDKAATLDVARRLDVPVPKSVLVHRDGGSTDESELAFPLVVRTVQSDLALRPPTQYALDPEGLRLALRALLSISRPVLVQELLTGEGTGVFALCDRGEPIVTFAHRRRREKPPWGGVSVLSESIPEPADILDYAIRILRELKWHGVAMMEFKRSAAGMPYLMEVNPRFWGSLELAVRAGVDFPYLFYQLATGANVEPPVRRRHTANRWVIGEVDSLVTALRAGVWPDGVRGSRLRTIRSCLLDLRFGPKCEVERMTDPGPAIYEYRAWLKETARALLGGRLRCRKLNPFGE